MEKSQLKPVREYRLTLVPAALVLALDTRFELGVHLHDMVLDPLAECFMEAPQNINTQTFGLAAFFELLNKMEELRVRFLVFLVGGAPIILHAAFLKFEMRARVQFQKVHKTDQEFALLRGRIGLCQHTLQVVEIVEQHLVLLINCIRPG